MTATTATRSSTSLVTEAATAEGDERYKLIGEAQTILFKDLPAIRCGTRTHGL